MVIVSYVKECLAFHSDTVNKGYTANEFMLWHAILDVMNEHATDNLWPDAFIQIPNKLLLSKLSYGQDTLDRTRNRLVQAGLIEYIPGKKGKDIPKYRMIYYHSTAIPAQDIHITVENYVEKPVENSTNRTHAVNTAVNVAVNPAVNVAVNPADIDYKTMTETKTKTLFDDDYTGTAKQRAGARELAMASVMAAGLRYGRAADVFAGCQEEMERLIYSAEYPIDMVEQAIHMAARRRQKPDYPVNYVKYLLDDWKKKGIATAEELSEMLGREVSV